MANGQRRGGGPGRSEETRIAPEEDEDATRDIPASYRPEETRLAPPEPAPSETRIGPLDEQAEIITDVRKGQSAEARGGRAATARPPEPRGGGRGASDDRRGRGQEVIVTEARAGGRAQAGGAAEARGGRGQEVIQTEARGTGRGPAGRGQEVIATEARGAGRSATGARGRGPEVSAVDDDDEDTSAAAVKGGDEEYQLFTTGQSRDED